MSIGEVANRAASSIIAGPEDLSEQENHSFHDLLQEWCNARPFSGTTAQVISDKIQESIFEKVSSLWDSDAHMITIPVLNVKKLKATSVAAGYFITNLPVTPLKSEVKTLYMSVKFEPNSQGKDFETCWKDECGLTVSSEFVRFKYGVTKAKAIVNLDKCEELASTGTTRNSSFPLHECVPSGSLRRALATPRASHMSYVSTSGH
ncbi:hypothetical protein J7337_002992 [Fusarium musae]|uniref:Uncharacterized protein n=1 Tax=Fusarium musae TaxID=1042133 RepID=A0A9P8IUN2_9HYPO|nr:hypothetical protein J7337_002992 [Fusarium musae]KAG9506018.1 hypothetical protein J7337_002992 [Fusarium musae]